MGAIRSAALDGPVPAGIGAKGGMSNSSVGLPTESRTIRFVPAHLSASASWTGSSREKSACQCSHSIGRRMNTFFRQSWRSAKFLTERSDHEAALLAGWQGDDVEIVVATVTASRNLSHWASIRCAPGTFRESRSLSKRVAGSFRRASPLSPGIDTRRYRFSGRFDLASGRARRAAHGSAARAAGGPYT
jgi:hypothetical protein